MKDKNKTYLKSAGVLALFGLLAKIVGGLYRIPLTNILGARGMGLYQLVFPVYALLLALTSAAIPNMLARQIARDEKGDYGYSVFSKAIKLLAVVGIICTILLFAVARPLAALQGEEDMYIGYFVIAPSIFFVAIMSAFRGWFNARLEMLPTAFSTLNEQAIKLVSGLLLAIALRPRGVVAMTVGALLGVTISEIVSLIIIAITYFAKGYKFKKPAIKIPSFALFSASIPFTIGGMILPFTAFLDSILIVNLLVWSGVAAAIAIGEFGLLTGTIGSLVSFPVVLTISLAVAIIPVIARKKQERDIRGIKNNGSITMRLALALALPCAIGLMLLSRSIVDILYPNLTTSEQATASYLLIISAIGIPFLALMQIYNSLLQALDKSSVSAKNLAIAGGIKIVGNVVLIPLIGIAGGAIATVICFAVGFLLNMIAYVNLTGKSKFMLKKVAEMTAAGTVMTIFVVLFTFIINNNYLLIALAALLGGVIYAIMLWLFKVFDKEEIKLIIGRKGERQV